MDSMRDTLKGFAAEAATAFTRAVQYTEEKLGTSEKTELDPQFESLAIRCDKTKKWTENIVTQAEAVLQPNPNRRVEDYLLEKFEKKRDRTTNSEYLGQFMIDAATDYGTESPYGSALVKVGHTQQRLGIAEREFAKNSLANFIQPLRRFLDGDMKTIMKERKILEKKRLDLDVCKSRLKKAKTMDAQNNLKPEMIQKEIEQAELELRTARSEFERQAEITRLLLEGISSAHANQLRCLNDFVEAQIAYYAQCQQHMADLHRDISSLSLASSHQPSSKGFQDYFQANSPSSPTGPPLNTESDKKKRARVLYDYDAQDGTELSLQVNEVITVFPNDNPDPDWLRGERGHQKGKVPVAYLEILS